MSSVGAGARAASILVVLGMLGACAFGNTVNYSAQAPIVVAKPTEAIAVAVQDRRPYVVSGEKTVQFVGLQRSGFGIPYGVHTNSGRPLADEFGDTIASSLGTQERKPQVVRLVPAMSREQVASQLVGSNAGKALLIAIDEWKSDLYINLRMVYALRATVTDRAGKVMGQHEIRGDQNLGAHPTMFSAYSTTLPAFQKTKLEELLNDPKISQALSQNAPAQPARPQRRR